MSIITSTEFGNFKAGDVVIMGIGDTSEYVRIISIKNRCTASFRYLRWYEKLWLKVKTFVKMRIK